MSWCRSRRLQAEITDDIYQQLKADMQFSFTATVSDPVAYRAGVVGMAKVAQRDMLSLVKQ
jgi:hypothetical protein